MTNKKGFTLIELLVVIAIIGILSAVVLTSLNSARTRAQDARIRATVNNLRAQAEVVYDKDNASYSNFCSDTDVKNATTSLNLSVSGHACKVSAATNATSYAMAAQLSNTFWYCIDSTGVATTTQTATNPIAGDLLCN